tara:strand:+ start:6144 stop:6809 length:666 start_codon:yes stop_codon:yes gene_type:complete
MNKLKTIIIAFFLGSLSTVTLADWKAGISATGASLDATGSEEVFGHPTTHNQQRSETIEAILGSVFIEKDTGIAGISLGLDVVPYIIESEKATNVRTDDGSGGTQDTGTNEVVVDIETPVTLYGSIPLGGDGAYIKVGASYANLKTKEKTVTSTAYPDADLYGGHISLGYEADTGQGFSIRAEAGYSQYTNVTVRSSSNRTKVHLHSLDGPHARLSIVRAF